MGYDVRITRRFGASESDGPDITEREWNALLAAESPLSKSAYYDGREIVCKNPGDSELRLMVAYANCVNARVIGDDGEVYSMTADGFLVNDGEPDPARRITWRQTLVRLALFFAVIWAVMGAILWWLGAFG